MERPVKPTLIVTLDDRTRDIIKPLNNYIFDLEVYAGFLESRNKSWQQYAEDLERWYNSRSKHKSEMDWHMFKPNKPGYDFANND